MVDAADALSFPDRDDKTGLSQQGREILKEILISEDFEEFMLEVESESLAIEREDLDRRQQMLAEARQQKLE